MLLIRFAPTFIALLLLASPAIAAQAVPPVEAARPANWQLRRKPVESPKPLPPVKLLVERLGSPKFAVRAAATRDLGRSGGGAVPALKAAAESEQPEVSIRALSALENVWLRAMEADDDASAGAALSALDALSASEDQVLSARVEAMLASYEALLQKYAINEVRRLGGTVRISREMTDVNNDGSLRPHVQYVVIGLQWTGGEEGLRHVRRVGPGGVFFIKGASVPDGTVERFQAAAGVPVAVRGAAHLGVKGTAAPIQGIEGVLIESTQPGSAAEKAGLRAGDVIVKFDGQDVQDFEQLVKEIAKTAPGQTIAVTVKRQGEPVELTVTMDEWK